MPLTMEQKLSVAAAGRSYLGVPWLGQGRSREGIDCTGFIELAFHDGGMPVDVMDPRYQSVDPVLLLKRVQQFCEKMPKGEPPEIGDILLYGVPHEAHCALIVDGRGARNMPRPGLNMIHVPINRMVVETRFDPKRGDIRGIYRWRS